MFSCVQNTRDGAEVRVDRSVYPIDAILRTCYRFTDRAYILLQEDSDAAVRVHLMSRGDDRLDQVIGEFANALLDESLRVRLNEETRAVRELLVAQAFAEATLPEDATLADYHDDPRGIAK